LHNLAGKDLRLFDFKFSRSKFFNLPILPDNEVSPLLERSNFANPEQLNNLNGNDFSIGFFNITSSFNFSNSPIEEGNEIILVPLISSFSKFLHSLILSLIEVILKPSSYKDLSSISSGLNSYS